MPLTLKVNGRVHIIEVSPDTPLLWVLRDSLGLTGTKYACGQGLCGSCTVHLDGKPVRSCLIQVADVGQAEITTIEGLADAGGKKVQDAWVAEQVAQCGYCQPGMILAAAALLETASSPTDAQIDEAFSNHICRCGTHQRIRAAVHRAAAGGRE